MDDLFALTRIRVLEGLCTGMEAMYVLLSLRPLVILGYAYIYQRYIIHVYTADVLTLL